MNTLLAVGLAAVGLAGFSSANAAVAAQPATASLPSIAHVNEIDVHVGIHGGGYRPHYHRHGRWVWRHHHHFFTHYY